METYSPGTTTVQTLEDEHGIAFKSRGRKRCRICHQNFGVFPAGEDFTKQIENNNVGLSRRSVFAAYVVIVYLVTFEIPA
eukprot:3839368-Amphidinium_carterae.1